MNVCAICTAMDCWCCLIALMLSMFDEMLHFKNYELTLLTFFVNFRTSLNWDFIALAWRYDKQRILPYLDGLNEETRRRRWFERKQAWKWPIFLRSSGHQWRVPTLDWPLDKHNFHRSSDHTNGLNSKNLVSTTTQILFMNFTHGQNWTASPF